MTGVHELRSVRTVSAAPDSVRVSVLGGRTQLDLALPVDVPVAALLPELAGLITSRASRGDAEETVRDERRTFWVLSRVDGDVDLAPERSLRDAAVTNGELLRISQRRALSPPTLFDDVVDAAARLNRAAHAAWDATAAGVMAIAGIWAATAVWVYFLVAGPLSVHRGVVLAGAVLILVAMVGGAALVHRALGRPDVAAAAAVPVLALSAAIGWTLMQPHDHFVRAGVCALLLIVAAGYHRFIGGGRSAYLAAAVLAAFATVAALATEFSVPTVVLASGCAVVATLTCVAVGPLAAGLERFPTPAVVDGDDLDDVFGARSDIEGGAAQAVPSAEDVWARVRSAGLVRAGLYAGLAVVVASASAVLLHARTDWATWFLALTCATVLALLSRRVATVAERAALGVPAVALVAIACVLAQDAGRPMRLAGLAVLALAAVVAVAAGLASTRGELPRWLPTAEAHLEYLEVAALIPVALWPLGVYERLGL